MGNYDRALQWRMMQPRHPHATGAFFPSGYAAAGERRSGLQAICGTGSSDATSASATASSSYYTTSGDDRQGPLKRARFTGSNNGASSSSSSSSSVAREYGASKLSHGDGLMAGVSGPQRASALASYLPSSTESTSQYGYHQQGPATSEAGGGGGGGGYNGGSSSASSGNGQDFPSSDWFPGRSSALGSASLSVSTTNSYSSADNGASSGLSRQTSLASPTTMFGMENLMADYESGFYSLWNGPNGANVMGYDGESTPTDRHAQVETSHVYMPEEELKMDYPQLPDLNQGDLDYIYGSMDSTTGRNSEPHVERLYSSSGSKRDRGSDENKVSSSGMMSPTQSSLISPIPPSGFRSLARNATIETKRPAARSQAATSYHSDSSGPAQGGSSTTPASSGAAASRRPSSSSAAGSKRPRSRQCDFPGCDNRARSHQKCKKHGGAHQCVFEGCTKNSQSRGLCIAHGGGSRCKIDGCTRASQSKGRCKSHGGGEYCAVEGCRKKAHLKHLCRTHGGGVRCKDPKCMKWAQRKGWCMAHAKEVLGS